MEQVITKTKIEKLEVGKRYILEGEFSKTKKKTVKGDPFFVVTIKDNSGIASQQVWHNLPIYLVVEGIESGQRVRVEAVCTKVDKYTNIDIHSIEIVEQVEEQIINKEALMEELRNELRSFEDEDLKTLVTNVFKRPDVAEKFFSCPASQKTGYSHEGGLLTHVVRLIRLCKAVANVFNTWDMYTDGRHTKLNVDLLKTACILHDIGKVKTFVKNNYNVDKTDEGKLFEDSYLTMKIVLEELQNVNLPDYQKMMLEHVLASSKGTPNYGALTKPRCREAVAFHLIDSLDVQMANFEYLDRDTDAMDMFAMLFDKRVFLGLYEE